MLERVSFQILPDLGMEGGKGGRMNEENIHTSFLLHLHTLTKLAELVS